MTTLYSLLYDYASHNALRGRAIGLGAVSKFRKPTAKRAIPKFIHTGSGSAPLLVPADTEPSCDSHHHVFWWMHVHGGVMWRAASQRGCRTLSHAWCKDSIAIQ
ncbi:hypothetical protein ABVT39_000005 [Epinephelus coioides]